MPRRNASGRSGGCDLHPAIGATPDSRTEPDLRGQGDDIGGRSDMVGPIGPTGHPGVTRDPALPDAGSSSMGTVSRHSHPVSGGDLLITPEMRLQHPSEHPQTMTVNSYDEG